MKDMKVIKYNNLPSRPPIIGTATLYLLMDKLHAPEWLWGAVGVFVAVVWIITLYAIYKQELTDVVFKDK